jgi:phosphoribosylanthranilate isomerase
MARVRVKICGITHPADLQAAADAGADAVGFNFYPHSPRYVDQRIAGSLVRRTPSGIAPVGVFVNATGHEMRSTAIRIGLHEVQWHGDAAAPDGDCTPYPLVISYRVAGHIDLEAIKAHVAARQLGAVMIDARVPGEYGGTGTTAPWSLLAGFDPGVPVILAGGLTPENVAEAMSTVRPWGVDVASGVESSPGRKDAEKMRWFVEAVRAVESRT